MQFESLYISARAIIIQVSIKMKMILFVIDTQKGITDERLFEFEKFKSNVGTFIAVTRENSVEVVYASHDDDRQMHLHEES